MPCDPHPGDPHPGDPHPAAAFGLLDEPTRRALYELVSRAPEPVTRDQAADALDLPRSTAAFHLDRLVAAGLLDVTFRRLSGRTGPGAGRPSKLYGPTAGEIAVSLPPRRYDLAATVLAGAVEEAMASDAPVADALSAAAERAGRELAAGADSMSDVLRDNGFQPREDDDGTIVLGNCPFHRLVAEHPQTVCSLNLHLLRGCALALGSDPDLLTLDPAPGRCCVTIRPDHPPIR